MDVANYQATSREKLFRRTWWFALVFSILNLGHTLGLGNINWLERAFFIIAALVFLTGKRINPGVIVGLTLIFISIALPAIVTDYPYFERTRLVNGAIGMLGMLIFFLSEPTRFERNTILTSMSYVPLIILIISLPLILAGGGNPFRVDHTGAKRLTTIMIPAFLGAICYASAIAASLKYRDGNHSYLFLVVFNLAIAALTGTRMPTACAVLASGLIVFNGTKSTGSRIAIVFYGLYVIGLAGAFFGEDILRRFESGSMSGRDKLWGMLLWWHDRYPLFGIGFGHQQTIIPEFISDTVGSKAAHNEYLRILIESGYVGSAFFLSGILITIFSWTTSKSLHHKVIYSLAAMSFFLYSATDNTLSFHFCLLALVVNFIGHVEYKEPQINGES